MSRRPLEIRLEESLSPRELSEVTAIVAVSGGADSVALALALAANRVAGPGRLIVAHFNHGWRGAESDADERFVRELAESLDLPIAIGHSERPKEAARDERSARRERMAFLRRTSEVHGARFVLTAHTWDDQVETVLHRVLRGTGISGLAGIPLAREFGFATLVRPFLKIERRAILEYLGEIDQPFRSDRSNADPRYFRNRLRGKLLPLLREEYNPRVDAALARLGEAAGETREVLADWSDSILAGAARAEDGALSLDCGRLRNLPEYVQREVLLRAWRSMGWPEQSMGRREWRRLAAMIDPLTDRETRRSNSPGGVFAERRGEILSLWRPAGALAGSQATPPRDANLATPALEFASRMPLG